jgi:hypothetical protein
LKRVSIHDSVTSIGSFVFSHCSSLKKIIVPCKRRTKFMEMLPNVLHPYIIEKDKKHK